LGIIRSKLLLLHSDAASTEFNNYAQLVVTSMERATAGQVTKQQLANEVVPQLRGHLAGIQQALSQIKA
jgi:DNA-binding transcriptional regulator YdaS (Cro superfamily)